jgi:hypothetical protein
VAFPRNGICASGHLFHVSTLSVAPSDSSRITVIIVPRSVGSIPVICPISIGDSISQLIFEPCSRLARIDEYAFAKCFSLKAICIPASVEILCKYCLSSSRSLAVVTFESGSKLFQIDEFAFSSCSSLQSICIPSSVEVLDRDCFRECSSISSLIFESDSKLT